MRVFITGASGFVGSALVPELIGAGYQVVGLSRSSTSGAALRAAGAEVQPGSLEDPASLRAGAAGADAVIHLAFVHDSSRFAEAARIDELAIETLGVALQGSDRPLVVATGLLLPASRVAVAPESSAPPAARLAGPRAALRFLDKRVRSTIVCLPPLTHGSGDRRGFLPRIIAIARDKRVSGFIDAGVNRWAAAHVLDRRTPVSAGTGKAYRRAPRSMPWPTRAIPIRDIAEVIGRHLKLPVASIPASDAIKHFGWAGPLLARDVCSTGAVARELVGWEPRQPGLIADLEAGGYFQ